MYRFRQLRWLTAALLMAATAIASPAFACGGFFCFTQPVDQSAERILYIQEKGKITFHVQISYKGDDQSFSWVLPLQKMPEQNADKQYIAVGSDTIFQMLEQYTSPVFYLNWKNVANCYGPQCYLEDATSGAGGGGTKGGVQVLAEDSVGPYDYAILQGTSGDEIVKWLNDNKFVQPQATVPLIQSYAKQDYVFVALKLQKDKGSGDLVPISVTLAEDSPCLPIRLTALATQPDMPIVAWILDKARAVPKNYLHVELNDAAIDWLSGGNNYKTVVSKAVDQGSGHAFLTEMARKTSGLQIQFANPEWDVKKLEGVTDPAKFLSAMFQMQLPRTTQMQNLIKKYIKKPEAFKSVTDQEFYNCIQNAGSGMNEGTCKQYVDAAVAAGFDGAAFAKDLDDLVIKPLQLLNSQYKAAGWLTRLYTTLSAEEMTKDPIFASNADLPEVQNQHTADAEPVCEAGKTQASQVKLTFKDGFVLTLPVTQDAQNFCGYPGAIGLGEGTKDAVAAGGQPLGKLQVLDEQGPPIEIDQSAADKVDAELNNVVLGKPSLSAEFLAKLPKVTWNPHSSVPVATGTGTGADASGSGGTGGSSSSSSSGGCSAGSGNPPSGLWLSLGALGLWLARRRWTVLHS